MRITSVIGASIGRATKLWAVIGAVMVLGAATGCGASTDLRGSMHAYEAGNFRTAEARCDQLEQSDFGNKAQVRYLVYCGLTYYKLGEADHARTLLASGNRLYATGDPGWLKPLVVDDMNKALSNLNGVALPPAGPTNEQALRASDAPSVAAEHPSSY